MLDGATRALLRRSRPAIATVIAVAFVGGLSAPAFADEHADDDTADAAARELAERYAPVVMLVPQRFECDPDGEAFEPTSVDIVLDNSDVVLRQVGRGDPVVVVGPSASDLFGRGDAFYLDFPGRALDPGCTFERDFRRYSEDIPPTVYAHVVRQPDRPGLLALQYWFFWYYNEWNNLHEGDWEFIQLLFAADTVEEALAAGPISVGLAQHEGGERGDWDDAKVRRDGDRPIVYPSVGSHATYFGTAVHLGRSGNEGFGCDDTTGATRRLDPDVVVLPHSVDDPDDAHAWLAFAGRWGERGRGPFNGPTGPTDKARWTAPVDWHDGLRDGSVVVPAGHRTAGAVVERFCSVVGWGSQQLIRLQTSPLRVLAVAAAGLLLAGWLVRRTSWRRVALLPVVARREPGELLRTAPRAFLRSPSALLAVGVVYLPVAAAVTLVAALVRAAPAVGPFIELIGDGTAPGLGLVLFSGGLASAVVQTVVIAAVSQLLLVEPGAGRAGPAVRAVIAKWRELAGALARVVLIVGVLFVSVVGIPWAIRQLVRYQFFAAAVMVDGADARGALARSTELVRGRWWRTAVVLGVIEAAVLVVSMGVGLALLLLTRSLPLWTFSFFVTLTSVVSVPLGAVAITYLYGDAVAEHTGASAAPDGPAEGLTPAAAH